VSDAPAPRPTHRERDEARRGGGLGRVARAVVAPVISGAVGAVVFLIMIQGSFRKGHTTLDFNHVLGTMIQGETQEVGSTDSALGVIGDSVGPTGLWATIICGIALMVVHEAVVTRVVRRHWLIQAVPLWIITSLAVGVLYTSLADARFDTPIGFFGVDAGSLTPLVILLCSLGFALVGSRAHDLATTAAWWEKRPDPLAEGNLEEVAGIEPVRGAPATAPD
jgi:hypothetical protein